MEILNNKILLFSIICFVIILLFRQIRRHEAKWIKQHLDADKIILVNHGIKFFGLETDQDSLLSESGFLIVLQDQLVFKSRWKKTLFKIPIINIIDIYPSNEHKNIQLHQSILKIDFTNKQNKKDSAAFKVPYPPQWIDIVRRILILSE